ncbi:hypothetical protein MXB_796, partial [Myxobolus squamalis]
WSDKLAHSAKTWAQNLAKSKTLKHQDLPDEGENIAFITVKVPQGKKVTDMWYSESQNYDYNSQEVKLDVCHFTQIVWAGTKEFGVFFCTADDECFIVARYYPPGNIKGEFKDNVFPPYEKMSQMIGSNEEYEKDDDIWNRHIISDDVLSSYKETITVDHYNEEMLELHNKARTAHNVPPLILDNNLRKLAQNLAESLLLNKIGKCDFPKIPEIHYGKSITHIIGKELPHPRSICSSWYDGNRTYNFKHGEFNFKNGGFSQMIWKNTKKVGFGIYWGEDRSLVVALYYPAGNIKGKYEENVEPIQYITKETNI